MDFIDDYKLCMKQSLEQNDKKAFTSHENDESRKRRRF